MSAASEGSQATGSSSSSSSTTKSSRSASALPQIGASGSPTSVTQATQASRVVRQRCSLPSISRDLIPPPASTVPSLYPQSLWCAAQAGQRDTDLATRRRTYCARKYTPLTVGKYVTDSTGKDFSDPRYTPKPARSRSSSRTKQSLEGRSGSLPPRDPNPSVRNASIATTTASTSAATSTWGEEEEEMKGNVDASSRDTTVRMVSYTVVVPLYASSAASFYFAPAYAQSSRDAQDRRGPPRRINEDLHPKDRAGLAVSYVQVQENNLSRMGLYKIGPGAVAFNSVIKAFEAAGLKYTPVNTDFNVLWAKRATVYTLASMNAYQKVNHYPGTWGVGRKDRLAHNMRRMQRYFGLDQFDVVPKSFLLPQDEADIKRDAEQNPGTPEKPLIYILKPGASSCGRGIRLFKGVPPMPRTLGRDKTMVCQRYIGNPLLIYGRKFDLRLYCAVTSFDPLRIYLFDEGLVRFAAEKYGGPDQDIDNIHIHLTNYSVNKTAELSRESNGKDYECDDPLDIKWCLTDFKRHLAEHHPLGAAAWDRIQAECEDVVIKTFLSIEHSVMEEVERTCADKSGRNCFELFGLDLMADEDLRVRLLEVNIMPSLATGSSLDKAVKSRMLAHLLTLVRVTPYRRNSELNPDNTDGVPVPRGIQRQTGERSYKFGRHPFPSARIQEHPLLVAFNDADDDESILSPAEELMLREYEEELHCSGGFRCVYPEGRTVRKYLPFFLHGVRRSNFLLASASIIKARRPGEKLFSDER